MTENEYGVEIRGETQAWSIVGALFTAGGLGVLVTTWRDGPFGWVLGGILLVVGITGIVLAWVYGAETRRRTKGVKQTRGYYRGERPLTWFAHLAWISTSLAAAAIFVGRWHASDGDLTTAAAVLVVLGTSWTVGATGWSAVQKWRRQRAGGSPPPALPRSQRSSNWTVALCMGFGAVLASTGELVGGSERGVPLWTTFLMLGTGAVILLGVVVVWLRDRSESARGPAFDR